MSIKKCIEKFDAYLASEVEKELDRKRKSIDPIVNVFGLKMPLSEFDTRLNSATSLIDKFIVNRLMTYVGFTPNPHIEEIAHCFTDPLPSDNKPNKSESSNDRASSNEEVK